MQKNAKRLQNTIVVNADLHFFFTDLFLAPQFWRLYHLSNYTNDELIISRTALKVKSAKSKSERLFLCYSVSGLSNFKELNLP